MNPSSVYHKQCQNRPGWFMPDQISKVANHMKISVDHLFKGYLTIDWWELDTLRFGFFKKTKKVFILSPGLKFHLTGQEHPKDPTGECVFYENGMCKISDVRPWECSMTLQIINQYGEERVWLWQSEYRTLRSAIPMRWNNWDSQRMIRNMLGRKPIGEDFTFVDVVNWIW